MSENKKIRIVDIAKVARVSAGTVDRVLHNRGEVSEETRKHVLDIVKKIGYTPNLLAKSLATKKKFHIAVLIPDSANDNFYWKKPLIGIKKASAEISDFNVIIDYYFYDLEKEGSFTAMYIKLLNAAPDGVIFNPQFPTVAPAFINALDERRIPYIFIDSFRDNSQNIAYFGQNAQQSGHAAARLFHLGLDVHSRILVLKLVSSENLNLHLIDREKGFLSFFQHDSNHKHIDVFFADIDITKKDEPAKSLNNILKTYPDLRGIFVTNSKTFKVAKYLEDNHITNIMLGGYDLTHENIAYLEKGFIVFLIGQKPEEQGYNSIMAMFNYLTRQKEIAKINYSPIDIVMMDNLDYYKQNME